MSEFMLSDQDTIDDVNPFVTHDFSLPGGVRQVGEHRDFAKVTPVRGACGKKQSVYCTTGLCESQSEPGDSFEAIHPRRNIDCGVVEKAEIKIEEKIEDERNTAFASCLCFLFIVSVALLYSKR
jgi:hypothetical protein|tara:strand:- start:1399 stop:1770 length:372 start_codon:yes stop_codon:yes gene_type:complete